METESENTFNPRPFAPYKNRETSRAMNTMLRNEFRMIARYFSLVDSKSNIMIRLNSFILSGLILFFKFTDHFAASEMIVLSIFVFTTLASLTFAAIASRPIALEGKLKTDPHEDLSKHIFNLKRVGSINSENFKKNFDLIMRDQGLIYQNMANEIVFYSKVLHRKYILLRNSYNVFLFGIGLTSIIFVILEVLSQS